MSGRFVTSQEVDRESMDWGQLAWYSRPSTTQARELVVVEVKLFPGGGHNFHKHLQQEEVIYVAEGSIEQWLGKEQRILNAGDSVFIPPDQVHASFNTSNSDAKLLLALGPCIGAEGYELVEVADQPPWNTLRQT